MSFGFPAIAGPVLASKRIKQLAPIAIAIICGLLVVQQLGDLKFADVKSSIASVSTVQWMAALFATAISFLAVGQYDALFHRWLRTGVSTRRGVISGASAIALAQTLGMGLATGTLARWRALPELSLSTALKVTNYVSISFMIGLGVLSLFVLALPGAGDLGASVFSIAAVVAVLVTIALSFAQPRWLPFPLPPLRMSLRLLALVTVDVAMCALAFWILMPAALQPAFPALLAVFTLALGAGLLSGSPGGVGPFELCLITMMPAFPEPELVATVLAFRLVYYAIPALIAATVLMRPSFAAASAPRTDPLIDIRRAETKLAALNGQHMIPCGASDGLHIAEASQMLVAIGETAQGQALQCADLVQLSERADALARWPMLYKCSAKSAAMARQQGWSVWRISDEAWLDPRAMTLDVPQRRQLRRKLKQADKAGIRIESGERLPFADMKDVAADWALRMNGERGFSMGRFSETAIAEQRVFCAWRGRELIAFVTFHHTEVEWTLDLMRSRSDMPDGTMHALVSAAIEAAKSLGIPRVSLAAMPVANPGAVMSWMAKLMSTSGLRQFKLSFAPRTKPLYAAAPNAALLMIATPDLLLRIRYPDGLSPGLAPTDVSTELVQQVA